MDRRVRPWELGQGNPIMELGLGSLVLELGSWELGFRSSLVRVFGLTSSAKECLFGDQL